MLDQYLQRTILLLQDPSFEIYNEGDLVSYINTGRGQIAGQAECIRVLGTLSVSGSTQQYAFSSIDLSISAGLTVTGVQGVLSVRQVNYVVASGTKSLEVREWPYFQQYFLGQPAPTASYPTTWSQYAQGAFGTIFTNLLDGTYSLNVDCVVSPVDLTDDTTPEAIPYQFTDAVPFYGAYIAALTVGNKDMAESMYQEFQKFVSRARQTATPSVLPGSFAGTPDLFMQNRLGLQSSGGKT